MFRIALATIVVALGAAAYADAHATEYRRDNYGDIVGSDGSRAHEFGGSVYIDGGDRGPSKCRETADHHIDCERR